MRIGVSRSARPSRVARFGATAPRCAAGALLLGGAVLSSPALAQARVYGELLESEIPLSTATGRNQGVRDRNKPELEAQGLPLGGFRLYPEVSTGIGITTNVVGAEVDARSDSYLTVMPQVSARSQWGRHQLNATVNYAGARYRWTSPKDEDAFLAQVDGRLDVFGESAINGSASYRRVYEDQQEASFPDNGGGAVAVDQARAMIRASKVTNRVRWTGSADFNNFRYGDTITTTGTRLDLSFRDRDVYRGSLRVEYELSPDNSVFGQGTYRRTDYLTLDPLNNRTSDEWRLSAGAIADVASLFRIAGAVGYFRRTYDGPTFQSIGDVAVDIRADYYVTPITTISAIASRQLEEAAVTGASGYVATRVGARVDHELLRSLVPFISADYFDSDFKRFDRHDHGYRVGGGFDYTLNRMWVLRLDALYTSRRSEGTQRGPQINELRALTSLKFRI